MSNNANHSISGNNSISRGSNDTEKANQIYLSVIMASQVIIAVLAPVAVLGNTVVLTAIWKKTFQRTPFHILLSVLAFTDLCTGVASALSSVPYLLYSEMDVTSIIGILCTTYSGAVTVLVITLMSIERWLLMSRRSLVTSRRGCLTGAISLVVPIPFVVLQALKFVKGRFGNKEVNTAISAYMVSCYLATAVAYFKVFRIIRQHQQQVHGNQPCLNIGQPAINLAKYKKSVVTILYILVLFTVCFLPMMVALLVLALFGMSSETGTVYSVSLVLLFLSSSLNPCLYIWRMNDVRDGVKTLFRAN